MYVHVYAQGLHSLLHCNKVFYSILSKFVVDSNLIMMSKPKYIVILTGLFCSVVASSTSHFYSVFSVNILARGDFWYDNLGLWLGKPSPCQ